MKRAAGEGKCVSKESVGAQGSGQEGEVKVRGLGVTWGSYRGGGGTEWRGTSGKERGLCPPRRPEVRLLSPVHPPRPSLGPGLEVSSYNPCRWGLQPLLMSQRTFFWGCHHSGALFQTLARNLSPVTWRSGFERQKCDIFKRGLDKAMAPQVPAQPGTLGDSVHPALGQTKPWDA